jgi:type III secretory pathway component EscV
VTQVLLSFSTAYTELARRIADDLNTANIAVRYDQWSGGGGAAASQSVAVGIDDVMFVLPLLTPSDAAATWVSDEWKRRIYDRATARGIDVLPLRGDGELDAVPEFLRPLSFADLRDRYGFELQRLIATIRQRSGDESIMVPESVADDAEAASMPFAAQPVVLELGARVAALLADEEPARRFNEETVPMMYAGLFYELGVRVPELGLRARADLPASSFRIVINGVPEAQFETHPECVLVNDRVEALNQRGIPAEPGVNPATGADCAWIPATHRMTATGSGLMSWDGPEFMILALSSVLRRRASVFVEMEVVTSMLEQIAPLYPQLVAETVPKTVPLFVLTDVLRRLVAEEVSIRNLRRILLTLAEWGRIERDPVMLAEYARAGLQRQITHQLSRGRRTLIVFLLHPAIEAMLQKGMRHTPTSTYVALEPGPLRRILDAIREPMEMLPNDVQAPLILTTMEIRACVRRLVATSLPRLHVISYQELGPDVDVQPLGRIELTGFQKRPAVIQGGAPLW